MKILMLKLLLIMFFIVSGFNSYSQSRFSVSGVVDLGRSYRNIQILDDLSNSQLAEQVKEKRDIVEKPAFAYSFGVLVSYRLHRNFSISSGNIYKSLATFTPRIPNCWPGPPPNCLGMFVSYFPGSMYHEERIHWNYLSVPLLVSANLNLKDTSKFEIEISAGPSVDVLINDRRSLTEWDANENTYYTRDRFNLFNPLIFSVQGSAGITYQTNFNYRLGVSLYYNHSLSPIVDNSIWFKETMYSYGIRLSVNRKP